ncbi:MAG: methylmalonyl Co-A mutase-associated GTPase MeaB, partial [Mariniphaga sp.]
MSEQNKHIENGPEFKGLKVNEGIDHPESFSDHSVRRFLQKKRKILPVDEYVNGILNGNITLLSKAVTLVESSKPEHQKVAQEI